MDPGQVDILNVICAVIIADLSTRPVHAFDLDDFAILDIASEWHCGFY